MRKTKSSVRFRKKKNIFNVNRALKKHIIESKKPHEYPVLKRSIHSVKQISRPQNLDLKGFIDHEAKQSQMGSVFTLPGDSKGVTKRSSRTPHEGSTVTNKSHKAAKQVISLASNKIKENLQRRRQKKQNRLKHRLLEYPNNKLLQYDTEILKNAKLNPDLLMKKKKEDLRNMMLSTSENSLNVTYNQFSNLLTNNLLKNRTFNTQTKSLFSLINSLLISSVKTLSQVRLLDESKLVCDRRYKVTFNDNKKDVEWKEWMARLEKKWQEMRILGGAGVIVHKNETSEDARQVKSGKKNPVLAKGEGVLMKGVWEEFDRVMRLADGYSDSDERSGVDSSLSLDPEDEDDDKKDESLFNLPNHSTININSKELTNSKGSKGVRPDQTLPETSLDLKKVIKTNLKQSRFVRAKEKSKSGVIGRKVIKQSARFREDVEIITPKVNMRMASAMDVLGSRSPSNYQARVLPSHNKTSKLRPINYSKDKYQQSHPTTTSFGEYLNTKGSGTEFSLNKNKSVFDAKFGKTGIPSILKAKERREYIIKRNNEQNFDQIKLDNEEENFKEKIISEHRKREERDLINQIFDLMISKSKIQKNFSLENDLNIKLALIKRNCHK